MTDRELLQQALDVLEDWDSLIQHQYNGSKKAMSDLTICAQSTPPIIDAIKARLAQPEELGEIIPADEEQLKRIANLVIDKTGTWGVAEIKEKMR